MSLVLICADFLLLIPSSVWADVSQETLSVNEYLLEQQDMSLCLYNNCAPARPVCFVQPMLYYTACKVAYFVLYVSPLGGEKKLLVVGTC